MEAKVIFANEQLKEAFETLKESDKELYKKLEKARNDIAHNAFCGRNVKKKLIPKALIQKHNINNLWIYNLSKDWRLLYNIATPDKIEILAIILDWMDHKDYEKLFKF